MEMPSTRIINEKFHPAALPMGPPLLMVVVDTEEEFDWRCPFDRNSTAVTAMQSQHLAQKIFVPYGLKPGLFNADNLIA